MTESSKRTKYNFAARLGEFIIVACDKSFGLHNQVVGWITGRHIETISTAELLTRSGQIDRSAVVLVDVRSEAEQRVSRIPGAITAEQYESNPDDHAGKTIVPYCTVGGRSYLYARKLASSGIPTKNYRDSILGWCRAGLALEGPDGQFTKAVHPYWRIFQLPSDYEAQM